MRTEVPHAPCGTADARSVSPADLARRHPSGTNVMRPVQQSTGRAIEALAAIADSAGPRGETLAVCRIVDVGDRQLLDERVFCSERSGTAVADAYEHVADYLTARSAHANLFIQNTVARRWFAAQTHWHLSPAALSDSRMNEVLADAQQTLAAHARTRHAAAKPLRVATDASSRIGSPGAGIAFVTEHGSCRQAYLESVHSINDAELEAIEMALRTLKATKLLIVTDSLVSARWIRGESTPASSRTGRLLTRIHRLAADREVSVEWIKGHAGDPLNETADRLARAARRNADANVSREVQDQIRCSILHDLQAA